MIESILNFLGAGGIAQLSIGALLLTGLVLTQVTIASVTIYLHRHQAHRALVMDDHRYGNPRVGGYPPQAPREMRDAG